MSITIETVHTKPFQGQKPGTSGLRKKVREFMQPNYLENFVASILYSLPSNELQGSTLVVSGDGRYFNDKAIIIIIRMLAAYGISRVLIGQNGLLSTPCVSGVIRSMKCYGGIVLTASHNPGGIDEDFGIKYNTSNGGPANETLTDKIYQYTTKITEYKIAQEQPNVNLSQIGEYRFGGLDVEIIDGPKIYASLMKSIFDFNAIKQLISRNDFRFVYDAMYGVAGPFAKEVFINELGAPESSLVNATPSPDFNHGHPDPNLTYAHDLVKIMGLNERGEKVGSSNDNSIPDFGAAADGDADRNMILGKQFFVTPSDSLALIAAHTDAIPYFTKNGMYGVARSMPTSMAVDRVAEQLKLKCYEVPTGWKYFGNLMDDNRISVCGEESFGTGSNHIREKDGMWAVLAWLSILVHYNKNNNGKLVTVQEIVEKHWKTYGRNFYSRYDYENVSTEAGNAVMITLNNYVNNDVKPNETKLGSFTISKADNFTYTDPVDNSVSKNQGIRLIFSDGSRLVWRLSGTGSSGATIRLYIEKYEQHNSSNLLADTQSVLKELVQIALQVSQLQQHTGRDKPTVIT